MSLLSAVRANELNVNEYVADLNLNPSNVYYARYSSTNVSAQQAQWTIQSPNRRNVLLSYGQVEWKIKYDTQEDAAGNFVYAGASVPWGRGAGGENDPAVSYKGIFPMANAMSAITVSINGTTQTISQPRYFIDQVNTMCVNTEEAKKCYENSYWESNGGHFCPLVALGNRGEAIATDPGLSENEKTWQTKALEGERIGGVDEHQKFNNTFPIATGSVIKHTEPLICPPFNPYAKVQGKIPNYLPWKKMSHVIPHIDRLEIDIQFQKLQESIWLPRYSRTETNGNNRKMRIISVAADLLLYWYEVPQDSLVEIPRSVNIQNWMVREFTQPAGAIADGAAADVQSPLIQLRSVPSFMILSCQRDKDDATYDGTFMSRDDTIATGAGGAVPARNVVDYKCRFNSVEALLADRPMVVSTTFSQAELYYLTIKNSKYPYPYSQAQWAGVRMPSYTKAAVGGVALLADADWSTELSRMCPIFRSKDLAEKMSDVVFAPTSLQMRCKVQARTGVCGLRPAVTTNYRLYVHTFDVKSFLLLEPDRAQFQLQSVSLDAATAALAPGRIGDLNAGGSLKVGGGLAALRQRGVDRYVPRVF